MLTSDPLAAGVHLVPLGGIASDKLRVYVESFKGYFSKAIGFRPTGWTYVNFYCIYLEAVTGVDCSL